MIRSCRQAVVRTVVVGVLLAAVLSLASPAGSVVATCPGTGSTFAGGSGTSADPYRIATAAQLASIDTVSGDYMGCSFLQTADISLASYPNWAPIGGISNQGFSGEFDGGGHRIDDLVINNPVTSGNALFDFAANAVFRHIFLEVSSTGGYNVAGLVSGAQYSTIDDVHVEGTIVGTGTVAGLLAGQFTYGTISRSSSKGSVSTTAYGGGLVGTLNFAAMSNSYSRASVAGGSYMGGLIGNVFACCGSSPSLSNSYATGAVTGGGSDLGGLVGQFTSANGTVFTNTGSVWDSQTTGRSISANGGTARTTAQMKDLATFTGISWDIVSGFDQQRIWGLCTLANDGYPFLQVETGGIDPCVVPTPAPTPQSPTTTVTDPPGDVVVPVYAG